MSASASQATERSVGDVPLWYHTLELPGGRVTPGWFDLRGIVNRLPWPDLRGKRCLDVGTYDGFFAFEMERRGAREVIATDIAQHGDWDLLPDARAWAATHLEAISGEKGLGFEVARRALGSSVEKRVLSVYELSPEKLGTFDVVVVWKLDAPSARSDRGPGGDPVGLRGTVHVDRGGLADVEHHLSADVRWPRCACPRTSASGGLPTPPGMPGCSRLPDSRCSSASGRSASRSGSATRPAAPVRAPLAGGSSGGC